MARHILITVVIVATAAAGAWPETVDPGMTGARFAFGEAAGWVNAEPLGNGGPGMHVSDSAVVGWLWSEAFGWISLSCVNTDSCDEVMYGVTHGGDGHLTGFAWAESAGWVSFSCSTTASCSTVDYGVVVDPTTGQMNGFAWAESAGWISFSCTATASCSSVDYGVVTSTPFLPILIFADGFECGSAGAWSAAVPEHARRSP